MRVALVEVETALRARGLEPRGALHTEPGEGAGVAVHGRPARTVVLAGQVGASLWARFVRERRPEPEPLDAWSARALAAVAERFGARVVLPGEGPPHPPFLGWARRAEPVHPSPLGLLIHPDHGLWHAYRGALAFAERLALPPRDRRPSPCVRCDAKPCLSACPVGAFTGVRFDAGACTGHLRSGAAGACFDHGCLARAVCPVGASLRYGADQARFHLHAFLRQTARPRTPGASP